MIVKSLKNAQAMMIDSVKAENDKNAVEMFRKEIKTLGELITQLEQLLRVATAIEEEDATEKIFTQEMKNSLLQAIETCGEKTNNHTLDSSAVFSLRSVFGLWEATAKNTWRQRAEEKSANVANSLRSLKALLPDSSEADKILAEIGRVRQAFPSSAKEVKTFYRNVSKAQEIINGLNLSKEKELFVLKVRQQKATVADLSPTILEWLQENGLTQQLKVRF